MSRLTLAALAAALGLSTIALNDAMTYGFTGHYSAPSDDYGVSAVWIVSGFVHTAAYLLGAALLLTRGRDVDAGSRVRRSVRLALVASLVLMAAGMLLTTVVGMVTGSVWEPPAAVGTVVGVSFGLIFLLTGVLGLTLVRRPGWRPAAWTMASVLPLLGLTVLVGVLGSPFAHPAYAETAAALGVALVGLAPRRSAHPGYGAGARTLSPSARADSVVRPS